MTGRPHTIERAREMWRLRADGWTWNDIGARYGVSGVAACRLVGRRLGIPKPEEIRRRPKNPTRWNWIKSMHYDAGMSKRAIAKRIGISAVAVVQYFQKWDDTQKPAPLPELSTLPIPARRLYMKLRARCGLPREVAMAEALKAA